MRTPGLVAVSFFALVLPASCSPVSATALLGPGDGGTSALDGADGSNSSGSGGGADGGSCSPGDVATYQPVYHPAAHAMGACDASLIGAIYDACLDPVNASDSDCRKIQSDHAECFSCIFTPDTRAGAWGPIIDHGSFVTANVGGCIELSVSQVTTLGTPSCPDAGAAELACAKAVQALDGCEVDACSANCEVADAGLSLPGYESCAAQADQGGCSTYSAQASACTAPDGGAGTCRLPSKCTVTQFKDFYDGVVPAFCLPLPVVDAGAPVDSGAAQDSSYPPDSAGQGDDGGGD